MPEQRRVHVVLIDATHRVRSPELEILRAAGLVVDRYRPSTTPPPSRPVDVVLADLRDGEGGAAALLRYAFRFNRPVVVITDPAQVDLRLMALRHGAADHVVSPPHTRELVERLRFAAAGAFRRREAPTVEIDVAARAVRHGERSVILTTGELAILQVLMEHRGEVLSREQISAGLPNRPRPNTVEVHVSALRRKLRAIDAQPITTVQRRGYIFEPARPSARLVEVEQLAAERERIVRERDELVRMRDAIVRQGRRLPRAERGRLADVAPSGKGPDASDGP